MPEGTPGGADGMSAAGFVDHQIEQIDAVAAVVASRDVNALRRYIIKGIGTLALVGLAIFGDEWVIDVLNEVIREIRYGDS